MPYVRARSKDISRILIIHLTKLDRTLVIELRRLLYRGAGFRNDRYFTTITSVLYAHALDQGWQVFQKRAKSDLIKLFVLFFSAVH